jgi:hypothetical protein
MGPIFVVFGLPSLQLSSKIPFMFEMPSLVELLRWYVFVGNAEVGKVPGELRSE